MEVSTSREAITRIWEQLKREHRPGRNDGRRTAHLTVIEQGWGERYDIQDLLWETDDRADLLVRHNDDFDCLLAPNQLHFISRYRGPFGKLDQVYGHTALRSTDVAAFVMEIERLGFSVDAEPLVAALRPLLVRQKFVTNSELSVLWYTKQRHRCDPLVLRVDGGVPDAAATVKTATNYKATALLERGTPVVLRVDAAKAKGGLPIRNWISGELYRARKAVEVDGPW